MGASESASIGDLLNAKSDSSGGPLRALLRLTEGAPANLDPARQAGAILDELIHAVRAERGLLFLSREGTTEGVGVVGSLGFLVGCAFDGAEIREPDESSRKVINEAFADWTSTGAPAASYVLSVSPSRAIVAAPLCVVGTPIGAVYLDREVGRGSFSESEGELLVALAAQVPIVLEMARALTSRHRVEEELQRAQKLEAMSRLARVVAREFERALADIRTSTEALMSNNVNGSNGKIQAIQSAALRAEELTQQLTSFANGRAQKPGPININDRIRRSTPSSHDELLGPAICVDDPRRLRAPLGGSGCRSDRSPVGNVCRQGARYHAARRYPGHRDLECAGRGVRRQDSPHSKGRSLRTHLGIRHRSRDRNR